jgi:hypothetical protein
LQHGRQHVTPSEHNQGKHSMCACTQAEVHHHPQASTADTKLIAATM